jgi:hypothetical protein
MNTYVITANVEGIGWVEETLKCFNAITAQRIIERRYAPARVTFFGVRRIA